MSFHSDDIPREILRKLDQEQIELGLSDKFWKLMEERGKEPRVSLEDVEKEFGIIAVP